jgi:Tol biopolymer transport system component
MPANVYRIRARWLSRIARTFRPAIRNRARARIARTSLMAAALLPAGLLTVAAPAHAAFPGANGLIAFVTDRDSPAGGPLNDEIYVIDEQGTSRRLTNNPATDTLPAVSPNGKEIAFTSNRNDAANPNPEGDDEIYVMDVNDDDGDGNGEDLRRLTDDAAPQSSPAWSPDDRKIAFTCGGEVCLMDAEGSEAAVTLTNAPAFDGQPVFSPDGSKIAFLSGRDGNLNVYLMNADGSDQTRLTTSPATDSQPEFSPDGTTIAFTSTRDGNFDIYVMRAEPESAMNVPVNLTNTDSPLNARWPAWSPDGTKIAFWYGSLSGLKPDAEIYLMNADGTNAINLTHTWGGDAFPDWGPARALVRTTGR